MSSLKPTKIGKPASSSTNGNASTKSTTSTTSLNTPRSTAFLISMFSMHATCSVSMVLLNKTLALQYDYPWTVVFIQNFGTVLLGFIWPYLVGEKSWKQFREKVRALLKGGKSNGVHNDVPDESAVELDSDSNSNTNTIQNLPTNQFQGSYLFGLKIPTSSLCKWLTAAQAFFFTLTLFMSLKALRFVSVPLYVVSRNMVPAVTAVLERVITQTKVGVVGMIGLVFTVVGAVVYTFGDVMGSKSSAQSSSDFDPIGLIYAGALVLIVAACSVIDKNAVRIICQTEHLTINEANQNRVALSMPLNVVFIILLEFMDTSKDLIGDTFNTMSTKIFICLFLSTVFGFGMGTFNFYLQQSVNAATVQVANIMYKLVTTIISRFSHPSPVSTSSWVGFGISLTGIFLYTFGGKLDDAFNMIVGMIIPSQSTVKLSSEELDKLQSHESSSLTLNDSSALNREQDEISINSNSGAKNHHVSVDMNQNGLKGSEKMKGSKIDSDSSDTGATKGINRYLE